MDSLIENLISERDAALSNLSKPWCKFFQKFKDLDSLPIEEWQPIHLLGYFDNRFREHYKKNFSFSFKGPPSKCLELFIIKKVYASLSTEDPEKVRRYIDWVFEQKIGNAKIRSMTYLITAGFGNEFSEYYKKRYKPNRSTELPPKFKMIITQSGLENITTYGDLAFAFMVIRADTPSGHTERYQEMFDKLVMLGLRYTELENIT